jgi:sugar lactone lactonase YvrE
MKPTKVLLLAFFFTVAPLRAVETTFWQIGTFDEFLQGTLRDVSLSKDGELTLAPEARALFNPEEALALSLAADRNHNLYIGTGHQGKVFRVDANGKGSLWFTAREPDIFALATAPDGTLYVGSSPEGKIYRISPEGKADVFCEPKTKYIWALALDAKGNLYAGTGDQGKILKIDPSRKSVVFFDSTQTHIMCLTLDREGNLLAGSVPNGLIYRINPQGKAFVLYQASLPEIHDLATDSQGRIYAAALGGAGGKGTPDLFPPAGAAPTMAAPVATITVTAGAEVPSTTTKEGQAPLPSPSPTSSFNRPAPQAMPFPTPQLAQGRGSLIQILPDYGVETVWSSNNESIFGLAVRGDHVLFSTDSNGRIFDLVPSRDGQKLTLLTQTHEALATRLLLEGSDLYIATSNIARLFRIGTAAGREGSYESPVKDTKFVSNWGALAWRADAPAGSSVEFYTRSGNSERPDQTWSDWAGPYRKPEGSTVLSPPARYLQWKAVFRATGAARLALNEVTASYLNQNLPPQIRSLNVSTSGERTSPTGAPSGSGPSSSIMVSPGPTPGLASTPPSGGASTKTPTTLSWQADDPNGDQLVYALYVMAADEQEWHLLKDKLRQSNYTLDPNALPDGKYVARLVASDGDSNPPQTARSAELLSAPFWVDNTPPQVRVLKQEASGSTATVQFQVQDETSPLRGAEAATDGSDWREILSDDGIVDSRAETFTVRAEKLQPGEHLLTLRAYDTAGNAGVGKAVVRLAAGGGPKH